LCELSKLKDNCGWYSGKPKAIIKCDIVCHGSDPILGSAASGG
jgi:hypothetical protein